MTLTGRRRPDARWGSLPDDIRRGDYWKLLDKNGAPVKVDHPGNLTGTAWVVVAPLGASEGYGIGRLVHHTVREHEDGTITVAPGDGSSNSILVQGGPGREFHGYIDHGEWRPA